MMVFSSLEAARHAGFHWHSFDAESGLHIVEIDRMGRSGLRERALAFAKALEGDSR